MSSYRARVEFCRSLCDLLPSHDFCALCDSVIRSDQLVTHLQKAHCELLHIAPLRMEEDYPRMNCDTCPKTFPCYSSLERHSLMEHDVALRNVYYGHFQGKIEMLCGYCGETKRNIVEHLLKVHGKEIMVSFKLIQCPCCRIQFEKPSHFGRHLQLHFCKTLHTKSRPRSHDSDFML